MPKKLGTNPKDLIGITKVQLDLVPPAAEIYCALGLSDGAKKYGAFNWRKNKVVMSIYVAAIKRHLACLMDGEDNAKDSGYPHVAHAMACCAILADAKETGNLIDDRPKSGCAAKLLEKLQRANR